jgi:hypothetical protein
MQPKQEKRPLQSRDALFYNYYITALGIALSSKKYATCKPLKRHALEQWPSIRNHSGDLGEIDAAIHGVKAVMKAGAAASHKTNPQP